MSEADFKAAKVLGPKQGKIAVVAITTSSVATDLSGATQFNNVEYQGKLVNLVSSVDVFYKWGGAGDTVDEADTAPAGGDNRCFFLAAGQRVPEYATGTHLILKGGSAGIMRIAIASD